MRKFTKFPKIWQMRLAETQADGCTYRVALYLLDKAYWSRQVVLGTVTMQKLGVGRKGKRGALQTFAAGWTDRCRRASAQVTDRDGAVRRLGASMYPQDTYPSYPQDTYGKRLILKVCFSFFSFLLLFHDRIRMRDRWTKTNKETKPSSGNGRFPKRIAPNTPLNRGMGNIAGFDPPTLCASSNTGANRCLIKHHAVNRCSLINVGFRPHKPPHQSNQQLLPPDEPGLIWLLDGREQPYGGRLGQAGGEHEPR
jgi:hypothetical protein